MPSCTPEPEVNARVLTRRAVGRAVLTLVPGLLLAGKARENELKAAFLFNFAKFVEWPADTFADPRQHLRFTILGDPPLHAEACRLLADKNLRGHAVDCLAAATLADARSSHVLYLGARTPRRPAELVAGFDDPGVLTVSDARGFINSGGMIGFLWDDNRLGFEINLHAARRAHLSISASLLRLARRVRTD